MNPAQKIAFIIGLFFLVAVGWAWAMVAAADYADRNLVEVDDERAVQ